MPYRTRVAAAAAAPTPVPEAEVKTEGGDVQMADVTNTGGEQKKVVPDWLSKIKEGGVKKIPKDVQKRRRNFRLKKMLTPKPPMMVLFELVKNTEIQFQAPIMDPVSRLVKVTAVYENQTFEGIGPSKSIAKNICSEHILQHIAFKRCVKVKDEEEDQQENEGGAGSQNEDDTPWTALASVALFKLFNDWQAQGATIPAALMKGGGKGVGGPVAPAPPGSLVAPETGYKETTFSDVDVAMAEAGVFPKKEKKAPKNKEPKGPKTLPENPTSRHPVQLLNEMEGSLEYMASQEGAPPNVSYSITVEVNGQSFMGSGSSKKAAKKGAALNALAVIYNVRYPDSA